MADYIAFLDADNAVTKVVQAPNDKTNWAVVWGQQHNCKCIETAKDGSIRYNYAAPGNTYYADLDAFVPPSPFASWVLNKATIKWEPPVPMPADENYYIWDEETVSWKNKGPRELLEAGAGCIDCSGISTMTIEEENPRKRARNADGTYRGDDPSTPDVNEAWEGGEEPPAKGKRKGKTKS